MDGGNFLKLAVVCVLKSMRRKRILLYNQLFTSHMRMLKRFAEKRRKMRKDLFVLQCSVPRMFFSQMVPRVRRFQKKTRNENPWRMLQQPGNERKYFETFRMTAMTFHLLCRKLEKYLRKASYEPCVTPALPVEKQVAICLYKLVSCAEYQVIGNIFGLHKSTVHKYFYKVINALLKLREEYIQFPSLSEAMKIAHQFENKCCLPNIIGAIDGTHIPIMRPKEGVMTYINRRGWASIVMQSVVDSNYMFIDVNVERPGSTYDAEVFKDSGLYQYFSKLIPRHSTLVGKMQMPFMLAGDAAYPLMSWLMKPYVGSVNAEEQLFNKHLSSARAVADHAFYRLKGRWSCMAKRIDVNHSFIPRVAVACTILHNFVEQQREPYLDRWSQLKDTDENLPQPSEKISNEIIYHGSLDPKLLRNNLKTYLIKNF